MIAIRVPSEVVGEAVRDGDLIGANIDGCVVVPRPIECALGKVAGQNTMREALRRGASIRRLLKEYGTI